MINETGGINAVVFDWGGTLTKFHNVDLADGWRVAAQALAPDRVDEVADALLAAERKVWAQTETTMRSATTAQVLRAASKAVGMDVDAALHDSALTSYLEWWSPTTVARPEARDVLEALRKRGLRTGLLSNTHWPREQHERWLVRDGLADLLDVRIYTSDLRHVKPHREAF
ncbi:MAG: HAD family hydrolase, partial [Frankiales bacterium]|nr:HAD family hydrolase [Frankiales bacterium]